MEISLPPVRPKQHKQTYNDAVRPNEGLSITGNLSAEQPTNDHLLQSTSPGVSNPTATQTGKHKPPMAVEHRHYTQTAMQTLTC